MTWDEFSTRMRQEFEKRAEYFQYQLRASNEPKIIAQLSQNRGRFFFSPKELPGRIALIKRYLPNSISETIAEADEVLQHRFRLLGYRDLNFGTEIDWHLDPVHGKQSSLKPWYKIRFLDFSEVGDHKIIWELNRHQHLVTLAKAFAFTGNPSYSKEIERQFYSWQAANPYPIGINWGSSLEVAFRSLSWIWARNLLCLNAGNSSVFDRDLIRGLARNGGYIERYLSTYFSPNTHVLGEALALFFIGTLCPEIPRSARWKQIGFDILSAEVQRQVRPDGVYFEQSLYYHVYAVDMFLHARTLAESNGLHFPDSFDFTVKKMLTVLDTLSRNGNPPCFGDDDGGRLFNPRRNRAAHMTDPLICGVCVFGDDLPFAPARLTEEAIWIFGEKAIEDRRCEGRQSPVSRAFANGGLYVIASHDQCKMQMLVDAGPHGTGHGGHGHADALSVQLSIEGQPWLIDPGTYSYISNADERNQFRGTAAHNTVRVDKLDQAVPETPFSWSSLPDVNVDRWEVGAGFTFFSGHHNGYQRLADPVVHRRMIFHLHGEYWLVRDILEGRGEHHVEHFLHFAHDLQVLANGDVITASRDGQRLTVLSSGSQQLDAMTEVAFFSPAYGERHPAPVGIFRADAQLPIEHAMLIMSLDASQQLGNFQRCGANVNLKDAVEYRYQAGEISDQLILSNPGQRWNSSGFASDARLFFVRRKEHEITYLIFCDATFVEMEGHRIFSSPKPLERLEWTPAAIFTSDEESVKFFRAEAIRADASVT